MPSHDYAKQAQQVIDTQYRNPQLNIGVIAERPGVDRSQFSRKFHAVCGVSPTQHLVNRRIQYGLELLMNSKLKLKDIAARSGFNAPNYFSKTIKKHTRQYGTRTPTERAEPEK